MKVTLGREREGKKVRIRGNENNNDKRGEEEKREQGNKRTEEGRRKKIKQASKERINK